MLTGSEGNVKCAPCYGFGPLDDFLLLDNCKWLIYEILRGVVVIGRRFKGENLMRCVVCQCTDYFVFCVSLIDCLLCSVYGGGTVVQRGDNDDAGLPHV